MRKKKHLKHFSKRRVFRIVALLFFLLLGLGFSVLNTRFNVQGRIDLDQYEQSSNGVSITRVRYHDSNNSEEDTVKIKNNTQSTFTSHITLGNRAASYITLEVTVKNYTNQKYIYDGIIYSTTNTSLYSNTNIVPSATGITENSTVLNATGETGDEITFYVTFNYLDTTNITNQELEGTVSFHFTPMVLISYSDLTNANNETEEYIRNKAYTTMNNTTYSPTVNLGSYSGNIAIKNGDETVTLTENTDYTYASGIVTFLNELTESYTIYSVVSGTVFTDYIVDIIDGVTADTEGIYTATAGNGCTNTFIYDTSADANLRYVGATPCNYVNFNCDTNNQCELWRIIGVMNDAGDDPSIKMVKDSLDYSGTQWNNTVSNIWESSTLYNTLNSIYYNTIPEKDMILGTKWSIGGIESNWTSYNFYEKEHATKSTNPFYVGLFAPSDYGLATSGGGTSRTSCASAALNGNGYTTNCRTNNWLYTTSYYQWTMINRPTSANNQVYYITTAGLSSYTNVISNSTYYNYRPCVYLKPEVKVIRGSGSSDDPYVLSLS